MRTVLVLVLVAGSAFAQGYPPGSATAPRQTANNDIYASTFVSTGFSADGGTGGYAWTCGGPSCKYKLAEGSSMEMVATNNALTFNTASVNLPTTFSAAYACPSNASCYFYADTGQWQYDFPTSDTSGCAANREGGHKARSTDHRWVYCDGTTVQELAFRKAGSGAIDFGAIAGGACADGTFSVTGLVLSEAVACGGLNLLEDADAALQGSCSVSATNTVRVRACCHLLVGSCADPASFTFSAAALR